MVTVPYAYIWSLPVPLKVKILGRLGVLTRLHIKVNIVKKGVIIPYLKCVLCSEEEGSLIISFYIANMLEIYGVLLITCK